MSNQSGTHVGYNQFLFKGSTECFLGMSNIVFPVLPQHFEQAIVNVSVEGLLQLSNDQGFVSQILAVLPRSTSNMNMTRASSYSWFYTTFAGMNGDIDAQRVRLLASPIYFPVEVMADIRGHADPEMRRSVLELYTAQALLRATLNELVQLDGNLAEALVARVRAPTQTQPAPTQLRSPVPAPSLLPSPVWFPISITTSSPAPMAQVQDQGPTPDQSSPVPDSNDTIAAISTVDEEPRYYCPYCIHNRPEGHFNDMNAHFFEHHYRSNRASAWLKEQWRNGAMGPWTKQQEAEEKRPQETQADKKTRSAMKKAAPQWRAWRRAHPDACERAAQHADGYSDFNDSFVTEKFKNLAQKKGARSSKGAGKEQKKPKDKYLSDDENGDDRTNGK